MITSPQGLSERVGGVVGIIMTLALVIAVVITTPASISSAHDSKAARVAAEQATKAIEVTNTSIDVANCRAQARTDYDQALQQAADAKAIVDFTTNQGLAAALKGDEEQANIIAARAVGERQAALDASEAASAAGAVYEQKVGQAITDQDGFLKACHATVGGD